MVSSDARYLQTYQELWLVRQKGRPPLYSTLHYVPDDLRTLLVSTYVIVEDVFEEKERCRSVVSGVNGS